MATRAEIFQRIKTEFARRAPEPKCALCGKSDWGFGEFVSLHAQRSAAPESAKANYYPLITYVCKHCGNTHFINIASLGIPETDAVNFDDDLQESKESEGRKPRHKKAIA